MVKISIIIPTKNSSKTIEKVLKSINKQTFKNYEIIVVDGYSSDNTTDIARKYGARVYKLPYERSAAINFGAKVARGEIIYILGSDYIIVGSRVLEHIIYYMNKNKCDAFVIDNLPYPINNWSRVRLLERLFMI